MKTFKLKNIIKKIFLKNKLSNDHALICAEALINAELVNAPSHGLSRLKMYCDRIKKGVINPKPRIKIKRISQSVLHIDAKNSIGFVAADIAIKAAITSAKKTGLGLTKPSFSKKAEEDLSERGQSSGFLSPAGENDESGFVELTRALAARRASEEFSAGWVIGAIAVDSKGFEKEELSASSKTTSDSSKSTAASSESPMRKMSVSPRKKQSPRKKTTTIQSDVLTVRRWAVHPLYRGQGLGGLLLGNTLERWAILKGFKRILVNVDEIIMGDGRAEKLLAKFGYTRMTEKRVLEKTVG